MAKNRAAAKLLIVLVAAGFSGCYTVTLDPIAPPAMKARVPLGARWEILPATANYTYTVHSGMAGFANTWTIEVGKALVNYADSYLSTALTPGNDTLIRIDIEKFEEHGFEAHCTVRFTVARGGRAVFERAYEGRGTGYAARVIWGGAFAMKSAMRRTTDEALRSVFEQFIQDAALHHANWS